MALVVAPARARPGNILDCSSNCGAPNADFYTQLKTLFQRGSAPENEAVLGWYSGRCYWKTHPNDARNGILVAWMDEVGANNGPLFPPRRVLKQDISSLDQRPVDYFDALTADKEDLVNSFLNFPGTSFYESCVENDALTGGTENSYGQVFRWRMRSTQGYLVTEQIQDGAVYGYCYFSKKIK